MKFLSKLPLYSGIAVFIVTVLVSAIAVGQKGGVTNGKTSATGASASLSLTFVSPNTMSVVVSSPKLVAGIDATLRYNPEEIFIVASTLRGSSSFATTGGEDHPETGTFSFSAIPSGDIRSGIVASFTIQPKTNGTPISSRVSFVEGGVTKVLEKETLQNIIGTTKSVTATL